MGGWSTGCVSLTTKGSGGTAHTCCGRHSQYSCELALSTQYCSIITKCPINFMFTTFANAEI